MEAKENRNKTLARRGEEAAARYLEYRGYEILERNWICAAGEADIIARVDDLIVFIEVKTRMDSENGFPAECITEEKRDRYEKIALAYLKDHKYIDLGLRFDIITLVATSNDQAMVRHHINAFGPTETSMHEQSDDFIKDLGDYMRECELDTDTIQEFEDRYAAMEAERAKKMTELAAQLGDVLETLGVITATGNDDVLLGKAYDNLNGIIENI